MAKLYFNQLTPTSVTANGSASGYDGANAGLQSIDKQWRSPTLTFPTGFFNVDVDLGSAGGGKKVSGCFVHDSNADPTAFMEQWIVAIGGAGTNINYNGAVAAGDRYGRRRYLFKPIQDKRYAQFLRFAPSYNSSGSTVAELTFTSTAEAATSASNKYIYWAIRTCSYLIASGDVLRYDVWLDPSNPADQGLVTAGTIDVNMTNTPFYGRSVPLSDGTGRGINEGVAGSRGTWISRTISLTAAAGNTITSVDLVNENDNLGTYVAKYRNIRITDSGGGTEKLIIWKGGTPSANVQNLRLEYYGINVNAQGTPTDGLNYWRVGAVYSMQDVVDIVAPQYGFEIETVFPQVSTDLPNGVTTTATTGQRYDKIRGKFMVANDGSMTIANLLTALRSGVCILDLELADAPHRMWPLKMIRASDKESLTYPNHTEIDFEAVEVV